MGILNVTSDSFYDGGRYLDEKAQIKRAEQLIEEGSDIIDIGACSTRPDSEPIPEEIESQKLINAIQIIRDINPSTPISIDTFRSSVALKTMYAGADIINDISGGTIDENIYKVVADTGATYILMHIQGTPQNMQHNPQYTNVVSEVKDFFDERIQMLHHHKANRIILDPGFGFGKNLEHNFTLLKNLKEFKKFGYPVMAGISRKSMIYKTLEITSADSLNGTIVANTIALMNGADILRVHDVKEAKEAIKIFTFAN